MRIRTANNNRRRLAERARRVAALRRWWDRAAGIVGASLFPDAKPWFRFDLARPESDRFVVAYGGGMGGGKTDAIERMRERLAAGLIEAPTTQSFFEELVVFGSSAMLIQPLPVPAGVDAQIAMIEAAELSIREVFYPELFKTMTGEE